MATSEKKVDPPVQLPKCPWATTPPTPYVHSWFHLWQEQSNLHDSDEWGCMIKIHVGKGKT
jgi:hypothetical protein